jgi:hypothetical protein
LFDLVRFPLALRIGVLTNAHVVNEAVLIHVVKAGSTKKERAKVFDAPDCFGCLFVT